MAHNPKQSRKTQRRQKDERLHKGRKVNQWREDRMKGAIEEYSEQVDLGRKPPLRLIARKWNVPKTTLQRRVKGLVKGSGHASGRKPFIPIESERELASLLSLLSQRGFSLRKTDIQSLAFEFAKRNGIQGFSEEKQKAGYYWLEGFMKRNPGLKIKKPDALSPAYVAGLNKEVLGKWFKMYETTLDAFGIKDAPSHIWNCDESLLEWNFSQQDVGEEQEVCSEITADDPGELATTVLAAFNAIGTYTPPLIVFNGKRVTSEWLDESSENMCVRTSDNGWITAELFLEWGKMFVAQLPKDGTKSHLLLLDSHNRYVFNFNFLSLMKENNVEVMCYPAHINHTLQTTDGALFRTLKRNWCEVGRKWNQQSAGMKLPKVHFISFFMEAWRKTATVENAQAGFRATGMFPINPLTIPNEVFAPSATAECELVTDTQPTEIHTQASSDQPPASAVASFKDFVVMGKKDRGIKKLRTKTPSYILTSLEHFLVLENSKPKTD